MSIQNATERAARLRITFYDNAIGELERAAQANLAADPRDAVSLAFLARALYKEGRFAEARQALDALPEGDAEGCVARGDYHDYVGEAEAAANAYSRALELDPARLDALLGLAAVHLNAEEIRAAERLALDAAPHIPAEDSYQQARLRVLQGGVAGLKARKGGFFEKLRWGPGVLHAFEQARQLCPRSPYPPYALGRFFREAPGALGGGLTNAIISFERAVKLDPFYFRAQAALLACLAEAGETDNFRAGLLTYHQRFGELPAALEAIGPLEA